MGVGLGGGLEVGQTSVAPSKGTATGGDEPDKVVLSRDQLGVDRESPWPRGRGEYAGASTAPARQDEMSEEKRSAGFAGRGSTADPGTPLAQGLYD
ncbi:MAG: hypothetical protein WB752_05850, partial [Pseudolabrys sp.]